MGADAGFDMVPMLEAKDQSKWDLFLDEVKETFKGDPKMLLKKDKIEFDAGEHPQLTLKCHYFARFSAKITGSTAHDTNVEYYLEKL
ncbi:uncharacterized protein L201_001386 [Kwoniella dendrophila CBS 6074]|uniref:Topoisomerase I damage affected protein 2 n=1 Tax=Kwoniella dendrophila CBS 6074 TaxID=1295534 RepID=A0AAX4JNM9_9TREE